MGLIARVFGFLLIGLGIAGYAHAVQTSPEPSKTALIPAGFGAVLFLLGLVAMKESLRKHAMHLAAMVGLLGVVGALMRPVGRLVKGEAVDFTAVPVLSQLKMAGLCLVFVALCVNSFVQARKARARREAAGPAA